MYCIMFIICNIGNKTASSGNVIMTEGSCFWYIINFHLKPKNKGKLNKCLIQTQGTK